MPQQTAASHTARRSKATEKATAALLRQERFRGMIYDPSRTDEGILAAALAADYSLFMTSMGYSHEGRDIDTIIAEPMRDLEEILPKALDLVIDKVAFLLPVEDLVTEKMHRLVDKTPLARIYLIQDKLTYRPRKMAWYVWHKGWIEAPVLRWLGDKEPSC
jgi:hypothetical protein